MQSRLIRTFQRSFTTSRQVRQARFLPLVVPQEFHRQQARFRVSNVLALGAGVAAASCYLLSQVQPVDACGIMAYIGDDGAAPYLLEGLTILQSRGYDSAGIATVGPKGNILTTKFASRGSTSDCLVILKDETPKKHTGDKIGIAHTRWATHGGKTDQNAHPHTDQKGRIALVHNGTIENFAELKHELVQKGVKFSSETDTEVIAQLIGVYLDEGEKLIDAVNKTLDRLSGTWGLVILSKDHPDQLIAARNGSPLCVGFAPDRVFVASEVGAFSRHTRDYVALLDGEVAVVKKNVAIDAKRVEKAPHEVIELSPAPYPFWTIKEIFEQPAAISRALNYGGRFSNDGLTVKLGGLDSNRDVLLKIKHLILTGCGTSLYAGTYGAALMRAVKAFDTVQVVDAAELTAETFPPESCGLLAISQSGETKDTQRTVHLAQDLNVPRFSIVNQVGSNLARATKCGVYLNAGREHAVASTKAFITQITALALIAAWFSQNRSDPTTLQTRKELVESINRLSSCAGMALHTREQMSQIAAKLHNFYTDTKTKARSMFVLGKGLGESIAREGALKIKEISYIHAEGYSGGALKHGPFALLDNKTPVVLLILDDQHAEMMKIALAELKARDAYCIVITDKPSLATGAHEIIRVPSNGPLTAATAVIPLQFLAYELSVLQGIDPDRPRNLAKQVSTD